MKKLIIIGIIALMTFAIVPAMGLDTQTITVTFTPNATASIVCNQSTWNPGCGLGADESTGAGWGSLTNDGTVYVDVNVSATDTVAWTISGAADHNKFEMTCTPDGESAIVLTTSPQLFISALACSTAQNFGLYVDMPTSSSTNTPQTSTITFSATVD